MAILGKINPGIDEKGVDKAFKKATPVSDRYPKKEKKHLVLIDTSFFGVFSDATPVVVVFFLMYNCIGATPPYSLTL